MAPRLFALPVLSLLLLAPSAKAEHFLVMPLLPCHSPAQDVLLVAGELVRRCARVSCAAGRVLLRRRQRAVLLLRTHTAP